MKILVIEDELKTSGFLKKGLSEAGYVVDVAADGLGALHWLSKWNSTSSFLMCTTGCAGLRWEQTSI